MCSKWGKLWVNGKCLSIHHYDWAAQYYVTVYLNKGKNILLLEQYSPKESNLFSIQLRNYKFEMSYDCKALSKLGNAVQINPLTLISEPLYNIKDPKFKFMYIKNDNATYCDEYKIDIHDSSTGFVKSLQAKINEIVKIDIAELRSLREETLHHEWIGCNFKEKDGKDFVTVLCIFLNDLNKKRLKINDKALSFGKQLSAEVYENIIGRLTRQELSIANNDFTSLYWYTWQLKDIIFWI